MNIEQKCARILDDRHTLSRPPPSRQYRAPLPQKSGHSGYHRVDVHVELHRPVRIGTVHELPIRRDFGKRFQRCDPEYRNTEIARQALDEFVAQRVGLPEIDDGNRQFVMPLRVLLPPPGEQVDGRASLKTMVERGIRELSEEQLADVVDEQETRPAQLRQFGQRRLVFLRKIACEEVVGENEIRQYDRSRRKAHVLKRHGQSGGGGQYLDVRIRDLCDRPAVGEGYDGDVLRLPFPSIALTFAGSFARLERGTVIPQRHPRVEPQSGVLHHRRKADEPQRIEQRRHRLVAGKRTEQPLEFLMDGGLPRWCRSIFSSPASREVVIGNTHGSAEFSRRRLGQKAWRHVLHREGFDVDFGADARPLLLQIRSKIKVTILDEK